MWASWYLYLEAPSLLTSSILCTRPSGFDLDTPQVTAMNLNQAPSIEQLKSLLAACDDDVGHHILWVKKTGDVHISVLPENLTPAGFEETNPEMALRYETFQCGNGYVGVDAASDDDFVTDLFNRLTSKWSSGKQTQGVIYVG